MRVAVTGAGGRLGRALVEALENAPFTGLARADRLDPGRLRPRRPGRGSARCSTATGPRPSCNAAAWTDVDGCARDPDLALARNGDAVHVLAEATRRARHRPRPRLDERGVRRPARPTAAATARTTGPTRSTRTARRSSPARSRATAAYRAAAARLGIVRTAWLYGPPGNDFPAKILAAAERARAAGEPLKVVSDEVGSPTFSHDVAEAIAELLGSGDVGGLHHVVNTGFASRADWARELFRQAGAAVEIEEVPAATWPRASTPPAWAVLEPTPLPGGEPLRSWQAALADYTPTLLRAARAAR